MFLRKHIFIIMITWLIWLNLLESGKYKVIIYHLWNTSALQDKLLGTQILAYSVLPIQGENFQEHILLRSNSIYLLLEHIRKSCVQIANLAHQLVKRGWALLYLNNWRIGSQIHSSHTSHHVWCSELVHAVALLRTTPADLKQKRQPCVM